MSGLPWGDIIGVFTVFSMVTFIGIWIWAWQKRHRKVFKRLSEIPMEDDPEGPARSVPTTETIDPRQSQPRKGGKP